MNENALSKKVVSMILIMSIMMTFMVMPSNAIITETLVVGSVVAAFASACGIAILSQGNNAEQVNQFFYDKFSNWLEHEEEKLDVAQFLAGVAIQDGKLRIQNGISKILSRFMPELVEIDIAEGKTNINGLPFPIRVINADTTTYTYQPNINLGEAYTITAKDGNQYTVKFELNQNKSTMTHTGTCPWNGTHRIQLKEIIPAAQRPQDNKAELFVLIENGHTYIAATNLATGYYKINAQSFATTMVQIGLNDRLAYTTTSIKTGDIESVPSTTLGDDEETIIDIGTDIPVSDINQFAETVGTKVADGTLTATYTNGNNIPPVPETDMGWIKGFHSIWEYVERMVNSVSEGLKFIPNMIKAMPPEVSIFIYGGFVLLLFGGVISKLLQ